MEKDLEINKGLIEQAINSLNWEEVMKFYKIMGYRVGTQPLKIEGINKKNKLEVESCKDEIRKVIEYIINNDMPEYSYGPWEIIWVNGEWGIEINGVNPEEESMMFPILESKIQILFIPQSATVAVLIEEDAEELTGDPELDEEILFYETRLKKAVENQEYMIASKLRDLIAELKK